MSRRTAVASQCRCYVAVLRDRERPPWAQYSVALAEDRILVRDLAQDSHQEHEIEESCTQRKRRTASTHERGPARTQPGTNLAKHVELNVETDETAGRANTVDCGLRHVASARTHLERTHTCHE
jgi:hypothetical protein